MAFEYKLHELAVEEYADAYAWYENAQTGLGEKFLEAIDDLVKRISENPEFYSYAKGKYRQATVEGFPYTIVYKFFSRRRFVHISAIHHNSRNPQLKFRVEAK